MLTWARPTRFVTLTQAPDDWQALRAKFRKLTMRCRAEGLMVQWAWTVETGSKTGMKHIHALEHGDYIPQRDLQNWWGRIVHIEAIREDDAAVAYALKEAARVVGYGLKGTRDDFARHLALNGGRAYHMSRGYLHGKRTREVERIMDGTDDHLTWVVVPAVTTIAEGQAIATAAE